MASTKISERLYLGCSEDAESLAEANPHHITTVLTLCESPIRHRSPTVRYLHFPIRDSKPVSASWLNIILAALEDSFHQGPILVHCAAGLSRAPTVIAAFLDRAGFLSFPLALRYLEEIRPAIAPSPILVQSIADKLNAELSQETIHERL